MSLELKAKINQVELFITDVDGVLTDGGLYYGSNDIELKKFDVKDGLGIAVAVRMGLKVAILTGKESDIVERRGKELGIKYIIQGAIDKVPAYNKLKDELKLKDENICFIADDINDLAVMKKVGLAVAVADAHEQIKEVADYVTNRAGGHGAVREIIDIILALKFGDQFMPFVFSGQGE